MQIVILFSLICIILAYLSAKRLPANQPIWASNSGKDHTPIGSLIAKETNQTQEYIQSFMF